MRRILCGLYENLNTTIANTLTLKLLESLNIPLPEAEPYNSKVSKLDEFEFHEEVDDIKNSLRAEEQVMSEFLE